MAIEMPPQLQGQEFVHATVGQLELAKRAIASQFTAANALLGHVQSCEICAKKGWIRCPDITEHFGPFTEPEKED